MAAWHVTKGTDSHSNTITYTYILSDLCLRPVSITYGTNEARPRGLTGKVSYDDLDRLTSVRRDGDEPLRMAYAPNGNILLKTGVGAFSYDAETRPHAVTGVENADDSIPGGDLLTTFGDLDRIETVEDADGGLKETFSYGPDRQRWLSVLMRGGKEARRTVYAGNYERVTEDGRTREYYYLDGNTIAVRENGVKVFDATYDAWGRQTVTLWHHRPLPRLHGARDDGRVRPRQHEPKVTGAKRRK